MSSLFCFVVFIVATFYVFYCYNLLCCVRDVIGNLYLSKNLASTMFGLMHIVIFAMILDDSYTMVICNVHKSQLFMYVDYTFKQTFCVLHNL